MNTELLGIVATFVLTAVLAYPLGNYISKVFKGERTRLDFFAPLEKFIFRVAGIDPNEPMDRKQNMKVLLVTNVVFFLWAMLLLLTKNSHG